MRDIIIKLSHESESQEDERAKEARARIGRLTVTGEGCSRKVHLTGERKCDRIEKLTVLGSLFGKRKSEQLELWFINCLLDKLDKM